MGVLFTLVVAGDDGLTNDRGMCRVGDDVDDEDSVSGV